MDEMNDLERQSFFEFAPKILDGIVSGKVKESDLYRLALDHISHDPRLVAYDGETTARKFVEELFG